jgi:hypothetical protein
MVDPITLTGLALAASGGFAASQLASGTSAPTPAAPTVPTPGAAAAPAQTPAAKPEAASQQPTFLGAAAVPQQSGTKSLLGQ